MDLVYRQALIWTGAIYAPMLGWLGVASSALLYFVKYGCAMALYQPPKKPFSATTIHAFFLQLLLASLFFPVACFCVFVMAEATPQCGPLRDPACVLDEVQPGAAASYNATCDAERSNHQEPIQELTDFLLPDEVEGVDVSQSALDALGGEAAAEGQVLEACSARCWVKTAIVALLSVPMLLMVATVLCVALRFSRAQARRLTREVRRLTTQLAEEHHDKVRLLRVAGITLD